MTTLDEQLADGVTAVMATLEDIELPGDSASTIADAIAAELRRIVPALDESETEAMNHLYAFMRAVQGWELQTNEGELIAAIHVCQAFVIQHMLRRCAPSEWSAWYSSQGVPTITGDENVDRLEVELTEQFAGLDTRAGTRNFEGLPAEARPDIEQLRRADVGARIALERTLARRLIEFGAAREVPAPTLPLTPGPGTERDTFEDESEHPRG